MRPTVSLYQFMPYGAPELLESRPDHMSRALVLTCALALAVCALAGALASLIPVTPVRSHHIVVATDRFVFHQERVQVTPPASGAAHAKVTHSAAAPVAVREDVVPPSDVPIASSTTTGEVGPGIAITPGELGETGTVIEVLPARGDYVYVESVPVPVREVKPEYPSIARDAGVEGRVTVHVLVGKDGRVLDAVLAPKVQVPMLNESALVAARQWVFTPGLANGKPVACWTAIPFHFRLN